MKTNANIPRKLLEHSEVIFRIKRGLCGYVSYLVACEMNAAFSEYILYEPILRIMTARGFNVECEFICPGVTQPEKGDKKRLDFYATGKISKLALEVKWIKNKHPKLDGDISKLQGVLSFNPDVHPLLLLFGRKSHIEHMHIGMGAKGLIEVGSMVEADFRQTKFACRVFRLQKVLKME